MRLFAAFASLVVLLLVAAAGAAALALGTQTGQELLRQQTAFLADRLLGAEYSLRLGAQTLRVDGAGLAVSFRDVSIIENGNEDSVASAARISAGLDLSAILRGKVDFDRLEVSGLSVEDPLFRQLIQAGADVGPPEERWNLAKNADAVIKGLDRQLARLHRIGVETVRLDDAVLRSSVGDVTVDGELEAGGGDYQIEASAELGESAWHLTAEAEFDPVTQSVRTLRAEWDSSVPASFERRFAWGDHVDLPADVSVGMALVSQGASEPRQLDLTVRTQAFRMGDGEKAVELDETAVTVSHVEGSDELTLSDGTISAPQVLAAFAGKVTFAPDGAYAFQIETNDLRSAAGGSGKQSGQLALACTGHLAERIVKLEQLALRSGEGILAGGGSLDYSGPSGAVRLDLDASRLGAGAVKAFWPIMLAHDTRQWVIQNSGDSGLVETGRIRIALDFSRLIELLAPGNRPTRQELQIDLAIRGADVATFGALPRLEQADGSVAVDGPRTVISLEDAQVGGFPDVRVGTSTLEFTGPERPDTPSVVAAMLSLELAGPVGDLMAIADREPIRAMERVALEPENGLGQASVSVGVSFAIGDDVIKGEELKSWSVVADLDDAALDQPIEGRMVSGVDGTISIAPGLAVGALRGTVDAIPAMIDFSLPFEPLAMGDERVVVDLELTTEDTAKHLPISQKLLSGALKARIEKDKGGTSVSVDLAQAKLGLPWIGWSKGAGIPAALSFDLEAGPDGKTILRNAVLDGEGFDARGSITVDAEGVREVDLDRLALNADDDASLTVRRAENGYAVRLGGERIDARSLLKNLRGGADTDNLDGAPPADTPTLDLTVALDTVAGFGGEDLNDVALNYTGRGGEIVALSFAAKARSGAEVTADLSPRRLGQAIKLTTLDAGTVLRFAGLYERMEGGILTLNLRGTQANGYRGLLRLDNFALVNEPRIERLVGSRADPTSRSLGEAIGAEIETSRATFDSAEVKLSYRGGALRIDDGIIRGPIFGSSFEGIIDSTRDQLDIAGSFMPAYGINRVFGAIPLVGQILGNGNEGGLIGITYQLAGAFAEPTLTVNPISAIAPGIFRQIFSYE